MQKSLVNTQKQAPKDRFEDSERFADEVHEEVFLNSMERDVIDTPEFQRLFRISQVGFVHLVYPTANHTRGQHAIGTCGMAKRLMQHLKHNTEQGVSALPRISRSEAVLISLGALLHDIAHGPFSHDIEKKTHLVYLGNGEEDEDVSDSIRINSYYGPYEKHDDFQHNPTVYLALMDVERSVLARVLRAYSPIFWEMMKKEAEDGQFDHIKPFVSAVNRAKWKDVNIEILASLLFHLMLFEKFEDSAQRFSQSVAVHYGQKDSPAIMKTWGLGPEASWEEIHRSWYQPYRHDIIGNTLSADLVDYLLRDLNRLGISRGMDRNLLNFYVLAPVVLDRKSQPAMGKGQVTQTRADSTKSYYRCAIDLNDNKRGTVRDYLLNDVFRLLDLRYEIHEKAVNHRIVHSANAMLTRAILILEKLGQKPPLESVIGFGDDCPTLFGEETFLRLLIEKTPGQPGSMRKTNSIPYKLAERRVYRPLMIVPGDRAVTMLTGKNEAQDVAQPGIILRKLAAIVDSRHFASFFLFVSARIEEYLEHAIGSIEEVISDIQKLASADPNSDDLIRARNVIPKRVIIWTTPYKQLYKDPALLVKVDTQVMEIGKLQKYGQSRELRTFVSSAIHDAEMKYSRLWKLYVFISDGLFYTGTLAKLNKNNQCGRASDRHLRCLESAAQRLLLPCFRVAYKYREAKEDQNTSVNLETEMTPKDFQEILRLFLSEIQQVDSLYPELHKKVSAVDLKLYLHGDDTSSCRDVRYKFDPDASQMWARAAAGNGALESQAVRLLNQFGLERKRLLEREFVEFQERYDEAPEWLKEEIRTKLDAAEVVKAARAARDDDPSEELYAVTEKLYRAQLTFVDGG